MHFHRFVCFTAHNSGIGTDIVSDDISPNSVLSIRPNKICEGRLIDRIAMSDLFVVF